MQEEKRPRGANREICRAAEELYGSEMFLTDPKVGRCRFDHVEPPATQTEQDSREWCAEHEV